MKNLILCCSLLITTHAFAQYHQYLVDRVSYSLTETLPVVSVEANDKGKFVSLNAQSTEYSAGYEAKVVCTNKKDQSYLSYKNEKYYLKSERDGCSNFFAAVEGAVEKADGRPVLLKLHTGRLGKTIGREINIGL